MASLFKLTAVAEDDLDEILDYVLRRSGPRRADHVVERLLEACRLLGSSPNIGHRRVDLTSANVRFWPVWSYLIVYRAEARPIEIVRVLHGARRLESLLSGI